MKHTRTVAVLLCLCAAGPAGELLACGDKFIVPARGTRFTRAPLPRQDAAILLYASDASGLSRSLVRLSVAAALQKAGYRPTVASTAQALAEALAARSWDLIVVDVDEVTLVADRAQGRSATAVLPVSYAASNDAWKAARQRTPAAVKAPGKASAFVEMIDVALEKQRSARVAGTGL